MTHILVAGWFSFEKMGATAGDILACRVLCDWLEKSSISFDIAFAPPFEGGVRWQQTIPGEYSHVCFVCGPFGNGWPLTDFLKHFDGVKLIGLNLTLLQSLHDWNPFYLCYERDSDSFQRPDITFASKVKKVPVVGIILAHTQKEYRQKSMHPAVNKVISDFVATHRVVKVSIDTVLEGNEGDLKSAEEVESLIAKMDLIITTRLHGLVLALKNSVPVIAIDAVEGGAKVSRQAESTNWPVLLSTGRLSAQAMETAFAYCLSDEAKLTAAKCADQARKQVEELGIALLDRINEMAALPQPSNELLVTSQPVSNESGNRN